MAEAKKVLLVEDDAIIAMDMEMSLSDAGWEVIGPAATAEAALDMIAKTRPDVAILDFNIRGGTSEPVATHLLAMSIPVVFLSGDNKTTEIAGLAHCHVLSKPVSMEEVQRQLNKELGG